MTAPQKQTSAARCSSGMGTMVGLKRETPLSPWHLSKVNSVPQPYSTIQPAICRQGRMDTEFRWEAEMGQHFQSTRAAGGQQCQVTGHEGHHRSGDLLLKWPKLLCDPL